MVKKIIFVLVALLIVTVQAGTLVPRGDIVPTASSENYVGSAYKICNGAGLDMPGLLHGPGGTDAWDAAGGQFPDNVINGSWISFDLGQAYVLDNMWVWNYNGNAPHWIDEKNRGARNLDLQYSLDGTNWTTLRHVELQQPTEMDWPYAHSDDLALGVTAQYIKFDIAPVTADATSGNWGMGATNELLISEVAFFGTVVPEPATMALLGLGGLALLRRRRK